MNRRTNKQDGPVLWKIGKVKERVDEVNYRPRPTQPLLFTNSPPSQTEKLAG